MSERVYCSAVAKLAESELAGTAVHVEKWLLVEYARPWKPKAVLDNDLGPEINEHLTQLVQAVAQLGSKLRIQFIKQANSTEQIKPRIFLADGNRHSPKLLAGRIGKYADLLQITPVQIEQHELPCVLGAVPCDDSLLLVCTNGQRDLCCARFGLPLFESLRIEFGNRAWQTTHIGGHRYAPNLLCLPAGLVYGFVTPDDAACLINRHDASLIDAKKLRGRSCYSGVLQAAESFLRRKYSVSEDAKLQLESTAVPDVVAYQVLADDVVAATVVAATVVAATVVHAGFIELKQVALDPVLASCGAALKAHTGYQVISIK